MNTIKTQLLDVTLRDGSYAINFQFSGYDTRTICSQLEGAGIKYIEVGHGMGIGASGDKNGYALCTDSEYLEAAQSGVRNAEYGMFCIPGVASLRDVTALAEGGATFVRVGTNASEVEKSYEYIKLAKSLDLLVMSNYMKSYAIKPELFADNVGRSMEYGADVVYIVDSSGSMNEDDIKRYYDAIYQYVEQGLKIGFHGHNNLGLAVSNSILAVELGFDFVDVSLRGMGRSAGNAPLELVVANLMKKYHVNDYDYFDILNCADNIIDHMYRHTVNSIDITCGMAEFHTSYLKYIRKYSAKYNVNPLKLILEYAEYDKLDLNEKVLEEIAARLDKEENYNITKYGFNEYYGAEQEDEHANN